MHLPNKTTFIRFNGTGSTTESNKKFTGIYAFQPVTSGDPIAFFLREEEEYYTLIPAIELDDVALTEEALLIAAFHVMSESKEPFQTVFRYGNLVRRFGSDVKPIRSVNASTKIPVKDLVFPPAAWPSVADQLVMAANLQQSFPEYAIVPWYFESLPENHPLKQGKLFE